jgi:hypothetical protein
LDRKNPVPMTSPEPFRIWLDALEARHLADLSVPEVGRALRALSSCYVERRDKLAEGAALAGAGKRAAFALFYAPLHFLVARHVVRALAPAPIRTLHDLGCGTGAAGAAWALETPGATVTGIDRHPWAVAEASWGYARLGIRGRARQGDVTRMRLPGGAGTGILAAYTLNELPADARDSLLAGFLRASADGAVVLVIEPIARRLSSWWEPWSAAFEAADGRSDEWRFPATLPARQRQLAKAAGLRPDELTARTLFLPGAHARS